MGALTNFAENKIVDAVLRAQALGAPASMYVGLIRATLGYSNTNRSTAVSTGATIVPATPNGRLYRCTTAGTTGAGEPTWPTTAGGTVTDGGAVWTEMTPDFEAGLNLTEVSGGSYARVQVTAALTAWAGTHAAASVIASSGVTGTTSNNAAITFPAPSANWGVIFGAMLYSASSAGDPWLYGALATLKTVNNGDPAPTFNAAAFTFQIDN